MRHTSGTKNMDEGARDALLQSALTPPLTQPRASFVIRQRIVPLEIAELFWDTPHVRLMSTFVTYVGVYQKPEVNYLLI